MKIYRSVTKWLPEIAEARQAVGVSSVKYSDAVVLGLIHIESSGDENAHRPASQFHGLLQMGKPAAKDVGMDDSEPLMGDGLAAIVAFLRYAERYAERHHYQPSRVAALWKGGPGTARTIYNRLNDGASWNDAVKFAAENHRIPNLAEYVERFRVAHTAYAVWLDDEGK